MHLRLFGIVCVCAMLSLPALAEPGGVYLGWHMDEQGGRRLLYWSSQKATNGMGDRLVPLSRIRVVKIVRLTNPGGLFTFDPSQPVGRIVPGDNIDW